MITKKLTVLVAALLMVAPAHSAPKKRRKTPTTTATTNPTAPSSELNWGENAFSVLTGIESKKLAPKKLIQVLGVPLAINTLESLIANNTSCQKAIIGDYNNPRQNIAIFLSLVFKLAHHILPILAEERKPLEAVKKGVMNFATSEHLISFIRNTLPFEGTIKEQALEIALIIVGAYFWHAKSSAIFAEIENESLEKSVPGITWQVKEPSKNHIMLVNPWIKTLRSVLPSSEYDDKKIFRARCQNSATYEDATSKADTEFVKLTNLESVTLEKSGLPFLVGGKTLTGIHKAVCEKWFFRRAYISAETFAALSPQLQTKIKDLNQQEQNFAAYNLMNNNANYMLQLAERARFIKTGTTKGHPVPLVKPLQEAAQATQKAAEKLVKLQQLKNTGTPEQIEAAAQVIEEEFLQLFKKSETLMKETMDKHGAFWAIHYWKALAEQANSMTNLQTQLVMLGKEPLTKEYVKQKLEERNDELKKKLTALGVGILMDQYSTQKANAQAAIAKILPNDRETAKEVRKVRGLELQEQWKTDPANRAATEAEILQISLELVELGIGIMYQKSFFTS